MTLAIYIACALDARHHAADLAANIRSEGFTIVSRWHDVAVEGVDPTSREVRAAILRDNLVDMLRADVVVVDTRFGTPCATFSEVGFAVARGKPIVWLRCGSRRADGIRDRNIFDAYSKCEVVHSCFDVVTRLGVIASTTAAVTLPELPDSGEDWS